MAQERDDGHAPDDGAQVQGRNTACDAATACGQPADTSGEHVPELTEGQRAAALLSDDRDNPDLLVFEKTWGHRVLAGTGFTMLVAALLIIVYFAVQLAQVSVYTDIADWLVELGYVVYGIGIAAGAALIVPGILAVFVAKRPKHALWAVVAALLAFALVAAFAAFAVLTQAGGISTIACYTVLLAITPAVYLVASVKVLRSSGKAGRRARECKRSRAGKRGRHSLDGRGRGL